MSRDPYFVMPLKKISLTELLESGLAQFYKMATHARVASSSISHTSKWIRAAVHTLTDGGLIKPILADGTLPDN